MTGKVCLVTGGSSGVGKSIAVGCAQAGATVAIVGKDRERGEAAVRDIRAASGSDRVEWMHADVSDLDSVRALAGEFRRKYGSLHVLSINAAVLTWRRSQTAAGLETMFATNYLGHFLLANLLLDTLRASAPARVVVVSGHPASMRGTRLDLDDLMLEHGFSPLKATARAALARVLFTFELARRLEGSGVVANTFHPGLVRSRLPASLPWPLRIPASAVMLLLPACSATGIRLAVSPEVEGMSGRFYVGKKAVVFEPGFDVMGTASSLWEASERLAGIR